MPIDTHAPYAPAKTVLSIIDRYRNRGMQTPIDLEVLGRAGVSDSLAPRTLQALKLLDLIDEEGNPAEALEALRLVPAGEYQERFAEFLHGAYPEVFSYVDPAEDDTERVRDAFRGYEPRGQQGRMVSLFLSLAEHAGMVFKENGSKPEARPRPRPRPQASGVSPKRKEAAVASNNRATSTNSEVKNSEEGVSSTPLPFALSGLLTTLPKPGVGWTRPKRDAFMNAFSAVLDLCYPVEEGGA